MSRIARAALDRRDDRGIALPAVIISMAVLTLFALAALAFVVNAAPANRRTSDDKAAIAAAQAGVEEYASRLNARPTYYAINGTGIDPTNRAFTVDKDNRPFTDRRDARGVPVPGTSGAGAYFRYEVLTKPEETASGGKIRVKVTGTAANGRSHALTARFGQEGYLRFLYFSDVESLDPALGANLRQTTRDGDIGYYSPRPTVYSFKPDPAIFTDACSRHWYDEAGVPGRSRGFSYRSSASRPYILVREGASPPDERVMTDRRDIAFSCTEIQFADNDVITGPLHTNDAIALGGPATFVDDQTESSWSDDNVPAPVDPNRRWRPSSGFGGKPQGTQPKYADPQKIPRRNAALQAQASVVGQGCLYSGETSIRFDGTSVYVKSPGTTSTTSPACLNVANRANEQRLTSIPAVIYVQDRSGTCTPALGFPANNESAPASRTSTTNAAGGTTTSYDCLAGNAFVSGTLRGQTTLASENDIIITGDLKYSSALGGDDVLGLIPTNYAWIYHPVRDNGTELLPSSRRVRQIDAAILSLNRSFLVQNWNKGATDAPTLSVNGVIAQRFRGPVGTGSGTGYTKNYTYDKRLRFLPPPYFLTPEDSPWTVQQVTDG